MKREEAGRTLDCGEGEEEEEEGEGQTKLFLVGGVGVEAREEEERRLLGRPDLESRLLPLLPPNRLERKPRFGESSPSSLEAACRVLVFLPLHTQTEVEAVLSRRSTRSLADGKDDKEEGDGRIRNAVQQYQEVEIIIRKRRSIGGAASFRLIMTSCRYAFHAAVQLCRIGMEGDVSVVGDKGALFIF